MKKLTTLFVLLFTMLMNLQADNNMTGETIYEANCKVCHQLNVPKDMTKEQKMAMMKDMKAPPFSKVSAKIKDALENNESKFVDFITDYIQNPDANKSLCMPKAIKKFGVMPAIGKALSDEEKKVIAQWMFSNFNDNWSDMHSGKSCSSEKGAMKCASGKCGSAKNSSATKETMRCGEGKCGQQKCGSGK